MKHGKTMISYWCTVCAGYHYDDEQEYEKPEEYKAMLRLQQVEAIKMGKLPQVYYS